MIPRPARIAIAASAAIVAIAGLAGSAVLRRPLPRRSGEARLAGLSATVEVRFDRAGVPHIRAASLEDAARALGWVHAADRLFQMEMRRRAAAGRLSEVLGPAALGFDEESLRAGYARRAMGDLAGLSPPERRLLDAYAEGVSAWIATRPRPLELVVLGIRPAAWTAKDSLAFARLMLSQLTDAADSERRRFAGMRRYGAEAYLAALDLSENKPTLLPPIAPFLTRDPSRLPVPGEAKPSGGSNAWALSGSRTASGKPLLAGDPHLRPEVPGIWYLAHMTTTGGYDAAGLTLAGLPLVLMGRNPFLAWSITMNQGDDSDLFVERLDANGDHYDDRGAWKPLVKRVEVIPVTGGPPVERIFLETRHGPLDPVVIGGEAGPFALARTSSSESSALDVGRFLGASLAGDAASFESNWSRYGGVPFNVVWATADGHVGVRVAGGLPERAAGDGRLPVPGWTGEFDWKGVRAPETLPSLVDPPEGFVASANDDWSESGRPLPFAGDFAGPERIRRIRQMLAGIHGATVDTVRAMQLDVVSLFGERVRDAVAAIPVEGAEAVRARRILAAWDGVAGVAGPSRLMYEFLRELRRRAFQGREKATGASFPVSAEGLASLLEGISPSVWDDPATPERETRDRLASDALAAALATVAREDGDDPSRWRWGRVHRLALRHPFSGRLPGIGRWLDEGPVELPGDRSTVRVAAWSFAGGTFDVAWIPSARVIFDLADPDASRAVLPIGQSGQFQDDHYDDHLKPWSEGRDFAFPFTSAGVARETVSTLFLRP